MVNWFIIIIAVLVIFVLFKISHLRHTRHKFVIMAVVIIIVFFVSSLYFVSKANNIDITTLNGLSNGMMVYSGWLLNGFQNIGSLTGYAVGLDWSSKNKTTSQANAVNATDIGNIIVVSGEGVVKAGSDVVNKVKANTPKRITNY